MSPEANSFLSEDDLKKFAENYEINGDDLKHELPLIRKLIDKESRKPKSVSDFFSMVRPYRNAFESLHGLFLIAVTLQVTSASCERSFSKMKIVKRKNPILLMHLHYRRKKKRQWYVHPLNVPRNIRSECCLVEDMREMDPEVHFDYFRMSKERFDELLEKLELFIYH